MRIGIVLPGPPSGAAEPANLVDTAVAQARRAHGLGIRSVWLGQRFDYDAVTLAALVGREVPGLRVGTSAVPILGRHPLLVGATAQTAQAATGGRFRLGIALGARSFVRDVFGPVPQRQIALLREFLGALRPYLDTGETDLSGELLTARTPFPSALPGARPAPPVLVAAMGPRALAVTGELADGTLPYLAGPRTLAGHIVPALTEAASAAGRPAPEVVALLSGVVTDRVGEARRALLEQLTFYESIPSYRAVLDREGVARAGDLAVAGDEDVLTDHLHRYTEAGATEVVVGQSGVAGEQDQLRTWELLGRLSDA
jgi:F420-dependent oxidoreductase-like protein